ncbi:MAG: DUF4136 domain-containing protein [Burkholderiales bacterium]|nr:DUF4136 domain-containing protein [Burkholderiales bacterium]
MCRHDSSAEKLFYGRKRAEDDENENESVPSWCCLFGLAVVLLFSTAAIAGVDVDFDETIDFAKYKTYAWRAGTAAKDRLMQKRIENAVEGQLNAKGVSKREGGPDLHVITHASGKTEKVVNVNNMGYAGYRWSGWNRWGPTSVNVYEIETGTLIVDLLDASTNELVWRGVATKTLSENPQKVAKLINKVVTKMFKKFPPKQATSAPKPQSRGSGY